MGNVRFTLSLCPFTSLPPSSDNLLIVPETKSKLTLKSNLESFSMKCSFSFQIIALPIVGTNDASVHIVCVFKLYLKSFERPTVAMIALVFSANADITANSGEVSD